MKTSEYLVCVVSLAGAALMVYHWTPAVGARGEATTGGMLFQDDAQKSEVFGSYELIGDRCAYVICYTKAATVERLKTKSGGATGSSGYDFSEKMELENGQTIDWQCHCDKAESGTMTIQGSAYDLTNGNVFVYHMAADGKLQPTQVHRYYNQKPDTQELAQLREDLLDNDRYEMADTRAVR